MNIQFDSIHSPEELRALSEALNKIADVREALRVEFRLAAARDRVAEQPAAETAQEEAAPAPKRTRAKPAPAAAAPDSASATGTSETTSQPDPTPTATTAATEAITLEVVRAKLASLSQAGKAGDVKGLIAGFGVAKLTDVPADKFGELMAQAEAL